MNPQKMLKHLESVKDPHFIPGANIRWLIQRAKTLEDAITSIASLHRTGADKKEYWLKLTHEQCAETNAKDTDIARKALEGEK